MSFPLMYKSALVSGTLICFFLVPGGKAATGLAKMSTWSNPTNTWF